MTPVSFDGCFGWLHSPSQSKDTAVVVCPGIGLDEATGYGPLRLLADAFAARGYPTMRLHYRGTGDSSDLTQIEHWTVWQQDIGNASSWLRQTLAVQRIVLVGFRFGAPLAVAAAVRSNAAGLILLAPVMRGGSYIRQLLMISASADGGIEAGRVKMSADTVQTISQIALRNLSVPPGCKVAFFAQSATPVVECETAWKKAGIDVSSLEFIGLEPLLRPTFANHEAPAVVEFVVTWLCAGFPEPLEVRRMVPVADKTELMCGDSIETVVRFGSDDALFGILCQPRDRRSRHVVLIGNTSADPHCIGATVDVARRLAAGGVASLRFDFDGIGDSRMIGGHGSHVYESDNTGDFSAAIDLLERLGFQSFATYGLCSGAYHAYHAAIADPRITHSVLINLPFFRWIHGFPIEGLIFYTRKPTDVMQRMRTFEFWSIFIHKLFHGDLRLRSRFAWLEHKLRGRPSFAQRASDTACLSNQKMLFLVSEGDVSIDVLKREFADLPPPGISVELVPELNHSMTESAMRQIVVTRFIKFLQHSAAETAKRGGDISYDVTLSQGIA